MSDVADPNYNNSAARFRKLYGMKLQGGDSYGGQPLQNGSRCDRAFAYADFRGNGGPQCTNSALGNCWDGIHANSSKLRAFFEGSIYADPKVAACVAVVSMGDEVTLPPPDNNPEQATAAFRLWAQNRSLGPHDVGCSDWSSCDFCDNATCASTNPARFYHSTLFKQDFSIAQMKVFTDEVKRWLPHAGVGANFERE